MKTKTIDIMVETMTLRGKSMDYYIGNRLFSYFTSPLSQSSSEPLSGRGGLNFLAENFHAFSVAIS